MINKEIAKLNPVYLSIKEQNVKRELRISNYYK